MTEASVKRRSWALWLPLVVFGLFAALFLWGLVRTKDDTVPSRLVGRPLPAFDLPAATDGKPGLKHADLADGKPRLLNVFASWCIPCAAEAPQLARLAAAGVEVEGVAIRDHREDLAAFLQRNGNPYHRIGADDLGKLQIAIGSSGVPETYVIDGKGVIRYQHIGDITPDDVALLQAKLKEAAL
ncbi:DsbE family thiol:disulfide interchange protein [Novosphingobium aerophilum]|uniref:DsbE family thiol:disulfide interchange protein n=1 Tax=Novosphingobium aerophilum TaxID=2839843 RepID=A0A7X1F5N2_9SPHN|nr:DsbE family thiol:disulfide interchange protein [Novosphingobium aerophilum]MBC2650609.1 DsbE family thiol:disulfide interchange protein [Novosphingobium aerophilum]